MSSIISVSNLSKVYRIGKKAERADSFVGMMQHYLLAPFRNWYGLRQPSDGLGESTEVVHWALRDVTFDVGEGEVVGIIGRNGAGKSTLLKILSRITEPTSGGVCIRGRVSSLLEVGTGFHPELTGRENIYLNGTILGMSKREIDRKFEDIVDFSEVERFLDTAVKRYSSGMKVRLAFAIAANLDPEILIIDEVLAVGDASFQRKCMDRVKLMASKKKTILFVSHNIDQVLNLCETGILLKDGCVHKQGSISEVLDSYNMESRTIGSRFERATGKQTGIVAMKIDSSSSKPNGVCFGDDVEVSMQVVSERDIDDVGVAVVLSTIGGTRLVTSWNREVECRVNLRTGNNVVSCRFKKLTLRPGHDVAVSLWLEANGEVLDWIESAGEIRTFAVDQSSELLSPDRMQGPVVFAQCWSFFPNTEIAF
jgi:lipopolysaccharide transport system ATP-binding protein